MSPHKCSHDETLTDLKDTVSSVSNKVLALFAVIGVFLALMLFTVNKAYGANDQSHENAQQIEKVNSRVNVQEERLDWILDGIRRIEKKLEKEE